MVLRHHVRRRWPEYALTKRQHLAVQRRARVRCARIAELFEWHA